MKGTVDKEGSSWFYVVDLGKDENGKRKRKKKRGFKTKKEAQQALTKLLHEVNSGTYVEPSGMKYGTYLHEWLEGKKHSLSVQTFTMYEIYAKAHILPVLGHTQLDKLTPISIQKFVSNIRSKELADATVERIYSIVNASLNTAVKMQLIPKNVASLIDKPKRNKNQLTIWDVYQVNKFLSTAKESPYYMTFFLAIMTGMRQGEILGLSWKDVDLNKGLLYITQTLAHNGKSIIVGAKTKTSVRSIALSPSTIDALKEHQNNAGYNPYGLVVCSTTGTPVNPANLRREWLKLIKMSGIPQIRFHDLRHTHASLMLKQGEHIKVVSERLGHSKIQMTLDTYTHIMPNMQKEAASRFDNLISVTK
ncbi:tyrosine-type recombinase/integrase [Aneurinibacillus sp. REN35]|uniref:tyrosine-type recombinase/integrase n=1 Tax=Aneurinibacillus sp. REN35 TaxID=3237286 RepID=UPI003529466A